MSKSVVMAGLRFFVANGNLYVVLGDGTYRRTTVADALLQLKYILWLCQYAAVKEPE